MKALRDLAGMAAHEIDLLVIGGGILGCGVARDAAMRGMRVALVEKEDFGCGTTARSTRLVHGGLRYLELFDFALVRQALSEREILLRTAPHLVRGLPFLTPIFAGDRWSTGLVRAGMVLYDLLSLGKSLPSHRMLSPNEVLAIEPGISSDHLRGGALYYDAQIAYPERLCISNVLGALEHGAKVANYAEARLFLREGNRVRGAFVLDRLTGASYTVRARVTLNATGPWADEVAHLALPKASPLLRRTKGIHILVPAFTRHAVVLQARRDGRVFFAVPWEGYTLVGTTDTDCAESADTVTAREEEVRYLVEETRRVFPRADLTAICGTMAGIRALVRSHHTSESKVSRRHRLVDHASEGAPGLLSLLGGKITTYRAIAAETVDCVTKMLGSRRRKPCRTATHCLPGAEEPPAAVVERLLASGAAIGLEREDVVHLVDRYGTRARDVLALAQSEERLRKRVVAGQPEILAEVTYACRAEMARNPADFLLRRTGIAFRPEHGLDALAPVAREMGRALGWSQAEERQERERYESVIASFRSGLPN